MFSTLAPTFLLYLLLSMGVLWRFGLSSQQDNSRNFWIAPHSAGPYVAAFAAGASDMSSWLFLALPGTVYLWGAQDIFLCIGLVVGAFCSWTFIIPMLLKLYDKYPKAQSFIQLLSLALSSKEDGSLLRKVLTFIIVFFTCIYIAAGLSALAKILNFGFGFSLYFGKIVGCALLLCAAMLGGALGLNALELVQGSCMLILLLGLCWLFIGGGGQAHATTFPAAESFSFARIAHDLSWGLGYFGIPHILTRMSVLDKPSDIPKARAVLTLWMILSLFCAFSLGSIGRSYFPTIGDHELVIPSFLLEIGPQVAGVGLALMVGSCICAGCAQLYSSSSVLSEDILEDRFPRSLAIAAILLLSLSVSMTFEKDIFSLVDLGWAGLSTTFAPYIFLLYFNRTLSLDWMLAAVVMNFVVINTLFVFEHMIPIGVMLPAFFTHFSLVFCLSKPLRQASSQEQG